MVFAYLERNEWRRRLEEECSAREAAEKRGEASERRWEAAEKGREAAEKRSQELERQLADSQARRDDS